MRTFLIMLAAIASASASAAEPPNGDVPDVAQRLVAVGHLLNDSSIARQVAASGNAAAQAVQVEARASLERATAAEAKGDHETASQALREATRKMLDAGRMVDPDPKLSAKQQRDYQDRLDSVATLSAALDRINKEKGVSAADSQSLRDLVNSRTSAAAALAHDGQYLAARATVDEAYVAAKVAIEHLRGGDTLVRSLNFASKEEEYTYELDRNDTHRMLVQVLAREKTDGRRALEDAVNEFMHHAALLREDAERQAKGGDYAAAVETLERSTAEMVRAIRSAGVYIPG